MLTLGSNPLFPALRRYSVDELIAIYYYFLKGWRILACHPGFVFFPLRYVAHAKGLFDDISFMQ